MTEPAETRTTAAGKPLDPETVVRRIFDEAFNTGNMATIDELIAPSFVLYAPNLPGPAYGPEGAKAFVRGLRTGFPGFFIDKEDVIVSGNKVVVRFRTRPVRQLGRYLDIPPTGREVVMSGLGLYRVNDGQIDETWLEIDALGGVVQMGVIPPNNISTPRRILFVITGLFRMAFLEAKDSIKRGRTKA